MRLALREHSYRTVFRWYEITIHLSSEDDTNKYGAVGDGIFTNFSIGYFLWKHLIIIYALDGL